MIRSVTFAVTLAVTVAVTPPLILAAVLDTTPPLAVAALLAGTLPIGAALAQEPAPPHSLQPAPPPGATPPSPPIVPAEQVAPEEMTGLLGHDVVNPEGGLGRIVDLLVDRQGHVRAVVMDVGGFLGMGTRKVAVAWSALRFAGGENGPVISIAIPLDRIRSWAEYIPGRPVAILGTPGAGQ